MQIQFNRESITKVRHLILSTCSIVGLPQIRLVEEVEGEILENSMNLIFVQLTVNFFVFIHFEFFLVPSLALSPAVLYYYVRAKE